MRPPSKTALFVAAKRWDAAAINAIVAAAPALIDASDPKGRTALHIACAVKPGGALGEPNGIDTVTVLLEAGADLERARCRWPRTRASSAPRLGGMPFRAA